MQQTDDRRTDRSGDVSGRGGVDSSQCTALEVYFCAALAKKFVICLYTPLVRQCASFPQQKCSWNTEH